MWTSITDWLIAYKDSLGLILDISGFLVLLIGSISGLLKWKHSNAIKKAEYVQSLTKNLFNDKSINELVLMLDNPEENIWYDHKGRYVVDKYKEYEDNIDKLFYYLSYACYLKYSKLMTDSELIFFKSLIIRVFQNYMSRYYFLHICEEYQDDFKDFKYKYLLKYLVESKTFDKLIKELNEEKDLKENNAGKEDYDSEILLIKKLMSMSKSI